MTTHSPGLGGLFKTNTFCSVRKYWICWIRSNLVLAKWNYRSKAISKSFYISSFHTFILVLKKKNSSNPFFINSSPTHWPSYLGISKLAEISNLLDTSVRNALILVFFIDAFCSALRYWLNSTSFERLCSILIRSPCC